MMSVMGDWGSIPPEAWIDMTIGKNIYQSVACNFLDSLFLNDFMDGQKLLKSEIVTLQNCKDL